MKNQQIGDSLSFDDLIRRTSDDADALYGKMRWLTILPGAEGAVLVSEDAEIPKGGMKLPPGSDVISAFVQKYGSGFITAGGPQLPPGPMENLTEALREYAGFMGDDTTKFVGGGRIEEGDIQVFLVYPDGTVSQKTFSFEGRDSLVLVYDDADMKPYISSRSKADGSVDITYLL